MMHDPVGDTLREFSRDVSAWTPAEFMRWLESWKRAKREMVDIYALAAMGFSL